jgi:phosphoglucosamine mutase
MHELVSSSGIRGLAIKEISPDLCLKVGLSLSTKNPGEYVVGHDVRLSSPLLANSLIDGLNSGGSDSIFLGLAPTPAVAYYSRRFSGGIAITASHNPPEYNGIKVFDRRGAPAPPSFYESLLSEIPKEYAMWDALGSRREHEGLHEYIEFLCSLSKTKRRWRVGLDPGNGATCITAPLTFRLCGHEVYPLNLAPDGNFPGRDPEPKQESLQSLADSIRKNSLDVGFAYDGDGDRLAILDENGNFISQDVALGQMARFFIKRYGGSVVVNVDSSSVVELLVRSEGGGVHRSRVGDPYIVQEMLKRNAIFGGETCGAWITPHLPCPDGVLSSILVLNLLEYWDIKPSQLSSGLPAFFLERSKIECPNELKQLVMRQLKESLPEIYPGVELSEIDGLRLSWQDSEWALIRPSGTEPAVRITAESKDKEKTKELIKSLTHLLNETMEGLKRRL